MKTHEVRATRTGKGYSGRLKRVEEDVIARGDTPAKLLSALATQGLKSGVISPGDRLAWRGIMFKVSGK